MFDQAAFRRQFPGLCASPLIYLDNAATTQKPACLGQALGDYYNSVVGSAGRGQHPASARAGRLYRRAREKMAAFLGASDAAEVIFTRNATDSINLLGSALEAQLTPEMNLVVTELEHNSNFFPWLMLHKKTGAELRVIPLDETGVPDLAQARRLIDNQTKLVAFAAASNVTGRVLPVEDLLSLARQKGALTLLDASQLAAHCALDVRRWGCDFLALSAHKVYGPEGVGVLYGRQEALAELTPTRFGGGMASENFVGQGTLQPLPSPAGFEAGTQDIAGAVAFGAVLDFLGEWEAGERSRYALVLTGQLEDGLRRIPGISLFPAGERRVPVLSLVLEGVSPADLDAYLGAQGICVRGGKHCAFAAMRRMAPQGVLRISPAPYNTQEEIARAVEAVKRAADYFGGKKQ